MSSKFASYFAVAIAVTAAPLNAQLSDVERRIVANVDDQFEDGIEFLERIVNINSGTGNHAGVRRVGGEFADALEELGFRTWWVEMPDTVASAGHLFAERLENEGDTVLLIGHLDTVFEEDSPFQTFEMWGDTAAHGPGVSDMKGGDVVILQALRALEEVDGLRGSSVIVALMGDEEQPGRPIPVSRGPLIELARRSTAALAFEGGLAGLGEATIARRGISGWVLTVHGTQGHSSLIFGDQYGSGSVYGAAHILDAFHEELRGEEYLTFNPGIIVGGTDVTYDGVTSRGTAFGKTNVIARRTIVAGDIRTISLDQLERTKQRMRDIVARGFPRGVEAEIVFDDGYPPMAPTDGNRALLDALDEVSRDLGQGPVGPFDPGKRGAADVSFVAPYVDGLDGLGPVGFEEHSPGEWVELTSMPDVIKRAAILIHRLTR